MTIPEPDKEDWVHTVHWHYTLLEPHKGIIAYDWDQSKKPMQKVIKIVTLENKYCKEENKYCKGKNKIIINYRLLLVVNQEELKRLTKDLISKWWD